MTRKEFADLFAKLCIAFDQEIKEERAEVYFEFCGHIEKEDFNAIISRVVKEKKGYNKLPAIAELLEYAPKIQEEPCLDYPKFDHLAVEDLSGLLVFLKRHRGKEGYDPEIGTLYYPPKDLENELLKKAVVQTFGSWQEFCANHQTEWDKKRLREVLMTLLKDPFYRAEADKILGGKEGGRWLSMSSRTARPALRSVERPALEEKNPYDKEND
jgi:hypothetical protein